jgi:Cdc6-like AAA superfamily ATPase
MDYSINIKGYIAEESSDRTKRVNAPVSVQLPNSNEDGGRLRKFYWEFMKKVYDWKSVYLRGSIGDTLLAYVPPGINKRTNLIKNLECFSQEEFEQHLGKNNVLVMTWWEIWEQLANKGWEAVTNGDGEDAFQFSWAHEKIFGITVFTSKLSLMQYIARFPYPLQNPSQLAESLQRHGWTVTKERTGLFFEQPGSKTIYSYDSLVRKLFEFPSMFFCQYFDESDSELEGRILEAIRGESVGQIPDMENQESLLLAGVDAGTWANLRKILDSYDEGCDRNDSAAISLQLSLLADLLPSLGWKVGPVERNELRVDKDVWWRYMTVYRPPYSVYNTNAKFAVDSGLLAAETDFVFGRDFFFDIEHVAMLLLHNIDYICTVRPSYYLVHEVNSSFFDYSKGEVGKDHLRNRIARFFINYPSPDEIRQARESKQLDEGLKVLGWQVFTNRSGIDIFIPPTSGKAQKVTRLNYLCYTKGAHYYDDVDQVQAYFLAQEEAMNKQHTIRTAVSTAQSTPSCSPNSQAEKRSPIIGRNLALDLSQSSTASKSFMPSVSVIDETVVIAERDCFYWQSLKVFVKERFHGEILGTLVRLGWGHYLLEGRQEAIIYCVPEMTEDMTAKNIQVGTRLRRRDYTCYDRGESYFFDLTDADKLWEKVDEFIRDDGNLALHARSRQRYFRQFNPNKAYPGSVNVDDSNDLTMLPMVVSSLDDNNFPYQKRQYSSENMSATTPTSTLSMDTQGPRQKISAFYDFAILHSKRNYRFRYGDVMPILKRIGWDVKYFEQRAILLSPNLRHNFEFQRLCNAESSSLDKSFFIQLEREGRIRQGIDFFYEDLETEQICQMASRLIPEDVLLQHMPAAEVKRRRRRQLGLDSDDDDDDAFLLSGQLADFSHMKSSHKKVKEVVVRHKSPVSPLSDDEFSEDDEELDDEEDFEEKAEENNAAYQDEDDGLSLEDRYAYLELIELFKQEKKSFAIILNMVKVLGWKTMHYKREFSFICAPGIVDLAIEKGLCDGKLYVKTEFMQAFKQGKDFFDAANEREEFYVEVERRIPPHLYSFLLPSQKEAMNNSKKAKAQSKQSKAPKNAESKSKSIKNIKIMQVQMDVDESQDDDDDSIMFVDEEQQVVVITSSKKATTKQSTQPMTEADEENQNEKSLPLYFSPERDSDSFEYGLYKELAMCLQEDHKKYAHILSILIDLGWKKVYYESDCFVITPEVVKEADEIGWFKDAKKLYVKKDLVKAYEHHQPKVLFRESMDKNELFSTLVEIIQQYKQTLPQVRCTVSTKKRSGSFNKTPASCMIAKGNDMDEPSTFQQKFRQQGIAPLSARTTTTSGDEYFVSESKSNSDKTRLKKEDVISKQDKKMAPKVEAMLVESVPLDPVTETWMTIRDELEAGCRYGVLANLMKTFGWLSIYMNDTSTMCSPSMLATSRAQGYLAKNQRKMKTGAGKEFIRYQDYFVETEDNKEFFAYLRSEVRSVLVNIPVSIPSNVVKKKSKETRTDLKQVGKETAQEHPSTTRQLKLQMQNLMIRTHSTTQNKNSLANHSVTPATATHVIAQPGSSVLLTEPTAGNRRRSMESVKPASSPATSISTVESAELSGADRLRRALSENPIRFGDVFACLKLLGWEKKWFGHDAYLCNPLMMAALKAEEVVSGGNIKAQKNILTTFQRGKDYFHEVDQKQELYAYLKSLANVDFACEEPSLHIPKRSPVYPVRGWEDPSEAVARLAASEDEGQMSPLMYNIQFADEDEVEDKLHTKARQQPRRLFGTDTENSPLKERTKKPSKPDASSAMDEEFILDLDADVFDLDVYPATAQRKLSAEESSPEDNMLLSQVQRDETLPCNMDVVASDWDHVFDASRADRVSSTKYDVTEWPESQDVNLRSLLQQNASLEKLYVHLRNHHRWHRQFMRKTQGVRFLLSAEYVIFRAGRNYNQGTLIENKDYFVVDEDMIRVLREVCGLPEAAASSSGNHYARQRDSHLTTSRGRKRTNPSDGDSDKENHAGADQQTFKRQKKNEPTQQEKKPLKRQLTLDEEFDMLGDSSDDEEDEENEEADSDLHVSASEAEATIEAELVVQEDESKWSLQKYITVARQRLIAQSGGDDSTFPVPQRQEESLLLLDTITTHLANGRGGVVHVVGAPGTGKTLTAHSTARKLMSLLKQHRAEHLVNFAFMTGGLGNFDDVLLIIADQINFSFPSNCETKQEKVQCITDRLHRAAARVQLSEEDSTAAGMLHASSTASVMSNSNISSLTGSHGSSQQSNKGLGRHSTVPMTVLMVDELTDFNRSTLEKLLALALDQEASSLLIVATGNSHLLNNVSQVRPAIARRTFKQIVFEIYDRVRLLAIIQSRAGLLFDERAAVFIIAKVMKNECCKSFFLLLFGSSSFVNMLFMTLRFFLSIQPILESYWSAATRRWLRRPRRSWRPAKISRRCRWHRW